MQPGEPIERWRLFVALWPDDATRLRLARHADGWRWPAGARRTPAERLHVTLHFIGMADRTLVPALGDALRTVPVAADPLQFDQAEVWRGGIAVLEALVVPPALRDLHARLGGALSALHLPVEQRPWRPHVTLARHAQGARPPTLAAPLPWRGAGGFALVRSVPGAGYESLQRFA